MKCGNAAPTLNMYLIVCVFMKCLCVCVNIYILMSKKNWLENNITYFCC